MVDPYSTLGVSKGADEKAIKSAYRKLAKELHPDKNKDNPKAADRFSDVTKAYDLLSDEKKRAAFDRGEIDGEGNPRHFGGGFGGGQPGAGGSSFDFGGGGIDLGDIFDGIFGGGTTQSRGGDFGGARQQRSAKPPKGANVAYTHLVSFTDAATLAPQRLTMSDGKTVEFKLPKGVVPGQQIRIPGKGQPGPGGNGDAMVSLKIGKHPHFERDGDNIRLELPISLREAIAGSKVKVPTVTKPVMLTIPTGVQGGTTMRLKGKGFSKKSGGHGDQYVTLMIRLPDDPEIRGKITDLLPEDGDIRADLGV